MDFIFDLISTTAKEYGIITALMISAILPMLHLVKSYISKRVVNRINNNMVVNHEINGLLDALVHSLGCSRAMVYQYHNGQKNALNMHFQRVSCTHERIRGVHPMIAELKNFPASMFATWHEKLKSKGELFCEILKDLRVSDLGLYQTLNNRNVKSYSVIGLWNQNRLPLGFVEIDFCMRYRKLTKDEKERVKATSMKICGLLMSKGNR
jgi:hypothetical protein